jgi:nicotinamide-nucleotide amidase
MTAEIANIVNELGRICNEKSALIATAESCTGGGVAYYLTSQPGSSRWFDSAFVTYSNAAKVAMLGVNDQTLTTYGAVSEEIAREMALGALRKSNASITLAITGIAGPGGGTLDKPVGTCWFAWSSGSFTTSELKLFLGDRIAIREQAILHALNRLLDFLSESLFS